MCLLMKVPAGSKGFYIGQRFDGKAHAYEEQITSYVATSPTVESAFENRRSKIVLDHLSEHLGSERQ